MKSPEGFRNRRMVGVGTAILLSCVALTGCSNSNSSPQPNGTTSSEESTDNNDFKIERHFTPSGKMITEVIFNNSYKDISIDTTYSYCEGNDLVEVSYWSDLDNRQRSTNHPACADGKITPSDIQIAKWEVASFKRESFLSRTAQTAHEAARFQNNQRKEHGANFMAAHSPSADEIDGYSAAKQSAVESGEPTWYCDDFTNDEGRVYWYATNGRRVGLVLLDNDGVATICAQNANGEPIVVDAIHLASPEHSLIEAVERLEAMMGAKTED